MRSLEENLVCEQAPPATPGWNVPLSGAGVTEGISRRFCNVKAFRELFSVISRRMGWGGRRMHFSLTSCYKGSAPWTWESSANDVVHGQEPSSGRTEQRQSQGVCLLGRRAGWEYQARGSMADPETDARLYSLPPLSLITSEAEVIQEASPSAVVGWLPGCSLFLRRERLTFYSCPRRGHSWAEHESSDRASITNSWRMG